MLPHYQARKPWISWRIRWRLKNDIKFWCHIVWIQGDLRKICQICVQLNKQTNKQIKQTKWMKYQVIGDQSKEEKIWNLHYIGTSLGKKERKKGKNRASFLSIWVVSSKSKSKKNESKTDQINEEKLEIYRSNTGKGKERIGERLRDFQQIQVKFYQLFATAMRWSLENFKKIY